MPLRTTTASLSQLQRRVRWDELPWVFRDAITTAHKLGVQYLWIDSLCIIQDDRRDWARQSQMMGDVYRNALLTVGVVMSPDSRSPFLGPGSPAAKSRLSVQTVYTSYVDDEYGLVSLRVRPTIRLRGKDCVRRGPLMQRGWTFQERILSIRIVDFTDSVVTWNCISATFCEHGQVPRGWEGEKALSDRRTDQNIDTRADAWRRLVCEYSERRLTHPSDRLPALSGIAAQFQTALHTRYLAGLWENDMTRCLGWFRDLPTNKKANALRRPLDDGLPFWSWASVDGKVMYCTYVRASEILGDHGPDLPSELEAVGHIEILQASCTPSTDNELGELTPGSFIDVRGRVVDAEWVSDMYGAACVRRAGLQANMVVPDCLVSSERSSQGHHWIRRLTAQEHIGSEERKARVQGRVSCLLVYTVPTKSHPFVCVLLLGPRAEGSTYERVGLGASKLSGPINKSSEMDVFATGPGGVDYVVGEDEKWKDWEEALGTWENWEGWFADAELRTVSIV